jgi:hypothetical protein
MMKAAFARQLKRLWNQVKKNSPQQHPRRKAQDSVQLIPIPHDKQPAEIG